MKTKILSAIVLICTLGLWGCNDFLDLTPRDKVSNKIIWETEATGNSYINYFYQYLYVFSPFNTGDSQVGLTEGLTETIKYNSTVMGTHVGSANYIAFAEGGLSINSTNVYLGIWNTQYPRIERVNEAIASLRKFSKLDPNINARFEAELRFFRGFLYFHLIKRNKEVILYDEDMEKYARNTPLSTEAQGWDLVEKDLTFAAENLPLSWTGENKGRITKGAAYALLSRAMLYAERWEKCKAACDEVFKLELYTLVNGSTASGYKNAFKAGSTESILEFRFDQKEPSHNFDTKFSPGGDAPNITEGCGVPTQEMVESYELATGGKPDWSKWHVAGGTTQTPPYAQLEPRFHASILYCGATWKGRTIKSYDGDPDEGWIEFNMGPNVKGKTTTSYFLRKLVDESHTDMSNAVKSTTPWIAIRLAEVHLNRAEACYHLNNPSQANEDIKAIRDRVGLPYSNKSGQELFDAIRQERKIELFVESHLYWDMRRWKLAESAYSGSNSRVHGFKITPQAEGGYRYELVDCDKKNRLFEKKMYKFPIPDAELTANTAVQQFIEWR